VPFPRLSVGIMAPLAGPKLEGSVIGEANFVASSSFHVYRAVTVFCV
jgi:hypothetical protein